MMYFTVPVQYLNILLLGGWVTLKLCGLSLVLGGLLGTLLGSLRAFGNKFIRAWIIAYVELVRSVPFLILLFFFFYGLPLTTGLDMPPYTAAIAALSINCAAYIAQVVYGGVKSLSKGQIEAGMALGLGHYKIFSKIIFPQALRTMAPAMVNVAITVIKESALTSTIGFLDLLGTGLAIRESRVGQPGPDIIILVALFYFILCFLLSRLEFVFIKKWRSG
ncbi:ABC transporter permease subunit [Sodalis sp. dw_96]|uniref:ABC transporter permease subunit n=1 Tax=Sodalis sp. dw_96 TaxID=2719794 RepID=UPI001BD1CFA8|nr:ABC transporter permease subunit [Sodalis sp. dw_96]